MNTEKTKPLNAGQNCFRRRFERVGKLISKAKLIEALEKTKPGLANKEMIEQSTSFVFFDGVIFTYNDEISVTYPLEELKDLQGAVKAEELYELVTKISDDELEVDTVYNELRIVAGNVKAGLVLEEEIKLPILEDIKSKDWQPIPENFLEALKFVSFSCSKDMSKPVLICINVTPDYVEASDGFRVTRRNLKTKLSIPEAFLIPKFSAQHLSNYDVVSIAVDEEWAHFQAKDGTTISCRVFNDNYPDIDSLGILDVEGIELNLPDNLDETIERVAVFAKQHDLMSYEVYVEVANNKLKVKGQNEYGWVEEECEINYKKHPISFSTDPNFLRDMVRLTKKCTVGKEKMKFVGDDWVHVLALNTNEDDI